MSFCRTKVEENQAKYQAQRAADKLVQSTLDVHEAMSEHIQLLKQLPFRNLK